MIDQVLATGMNAVGIIDMYIAKSFQYVQVFIDDGAVAVEFGIVLLQFYMAGKHLQLRYRIYFLKTQAVTVYLVNNADGICIGAGEGILPGSMEDSHQEKNTTTSRKSKH
jgi:hypothetical protein